MGRAPNRRDLGPAPGPDNPSFMSAGKIQSRKPAAPAHGKKPLAEPVSAIADKVTGICTPPAHHRRTVAPRSPPPPRATPRGAGAALRFGGRLALAAPLGRPPRGPTEEGPLAAAGAGGARAHHAARAARARPRAARAPLGATPRGFGRL